MTMRTLGLLFGISCLVRAEDEFKQKVQMVKTEHVDFPSGGTVRLKNSTGELTIEGWDQPGVEIALNKSTNSAYTSAEREKASHDLDRVQIAVERQGDELIITTDFPRHRGFPPPSPVSAARKFDLNYRIKVPRDTRLIVDHDVGEVHFDDVTGDIHATALQGAITLHLPAGGQYAIDAKSDIGSVTSDFPGSAKRRFWLVGHQFTRTSRAPHRLYLRDGFGDIIILKIRKPPTPPSLSQ
jgi:hypothetical protein